MIFSLLKSGLWCSLAITAGLGPANPGSNPGSPTLTLFKKVLETQNKYYSNFV